MIAEPSDHPRRATGVGRVHVDVVPLQQGAFDACDVPRASVVLARHARGPWVGAKDKLGRPQDVRGRGRRFDAPPYDETQLIAAEADSTSNVECLANERVGRHFQIEDGRLGGVAFEHTKRLLQSGHAERDQLRRLHVVHASRERVGSAQGRIVDEDRHAIVAQTHVAFEPVHGRERVLECGEGVLACARAA